MVVDTSASPGGPLARLRAARRRVALITAPSTPRGKSVAFTLLIALTVGISAVSAGASVEVLPALGLTIPVVLGGFLLDRPALRLLLGAIAVAFLVEVGVDGWRMVRPGSAVVLAIVAVVSVELARDRERLGLATGRGDSMLLELRDQLARQGDLPKLTGGWHADVAQRSAGGSSFGGDFIVSTLTDGGKRLELAIVDVSGKGVDAGTRALLLSGALGGLLGAVAPERFLEAANDYLLRQEWEEGFATALHATIDLENGHYRLTSAGHPPAVHYAGGSGRWSPVELTGLVLGIDPNPYFGVAEGTLASPDALLLYTDGLVEEPGRDLATGIDRFVGAAERQIPLGFEGAARRLVESAATDSQDDRAVVLVWRD